MLKKVGLTACLTLRLPNWDFPSQFFVREPLRFWIASVMNDDLKQHQSDSQLNMFFFPP